MSNTPETDNLFGANSPSSFACLCRDLETQRDEARAEAEKLRTALTMFVTAEESFRRNAPTSYPLPGGDAMDDAYRAAKAVLGNPVTPTVTTADTSPEIFEAHGLEWYRHTPGDKMPCEPNARVKIFLSMIEDNSKNASLPGYEWGWNEYGSITGWRPADAPEKLERK